MIINQREFEPVEDRLGNKDFICLGDKPYPKIHIDEEMNQVFIHYAWDYNDNRVYYKVEFDKYLESNW
jgi:hypothetical protein